MAGDTALKPRIEVFADENLSAPDRERVAARLDAWLTAHLDAKLKPLMDLSRAEDLTGLARGLAFRLTENLGVLRREGAADDIKALDQSDRGQLRKYGVRFGAFNLYFPALLKPAAAELLLQLWALHGGAEYGIDIDAMPERPQQGLTSVPANGALPEPYWRAAGFHVAGSRAVRIDMLERLSDLIRARVTWRPAEKVETPEPAAATEAEPAAETSETGAAPTEVSATETEGAPAEAAPTPQAAPAAKAKPEAPQPPSGATGDGGFRVVPELMSMVGCSGEEFASILRGLGFRLERRKIEVPTEPQLKAAPSEDAPAASEPDAATGEASVQEPPAQDAPAQDAPAQDEHAGAATAPAEPEPVFDEIWRPAKRRHQQGHHQRGKGRHGGRADGKQASDGAERPHRQRGQQGDHQASPIRRVANTENRPAKAARAIASAAKARARNGARRPNENRRLRTRPSPPSRICATAWRHAAARAGARTRPRDGPAPRQMALVRAGREDTLGSDASHRGRQSPDQRRTGAETQPDRATRRRHHGNTARTARGLARPRCRRPARPGTPGPDPLRGSDPADRRDRRRACPRGPRGRAAHQAGPPAHRHAPGVLELETAPAHARSRAAEIQPQRAAESRKSILKIGVSQQVPRLVLPTLLL
ncbi:hypothetical protein AUC70_15685 [Methyloceanibacter stevinii]|uniref:Uncharacterized protein n=1 Tax=Methyloceanibacter stevinii TaxID=1774970 RepID=A0A1E3VS16_9HYPH|nr:hypothetical protein AUC70_15685 [Methyloceanibacter stevinii]